MDCTGFNETSINTQIKDSTLIVEGAEGDPSKKGIDDFSYKEFKRTFELPPNVIRNRMVSFLTNQGILVIEFPFRDDRLRKTIFPKIVDIAGVRGVELEIVIPENVDPDRVTVTVWDHDLIIRADYRVQKPDGFSRIHYLRRSTFPQNTNWDTLRCVADQHDLKITAELGPRFKKAVRVEFKQHQPQQQPQMLEKQMQQPQQQSNQQPPQQELKQQPQKFQQQQQQQQQQQPQQQPKLQQPKLQQQPPRTQQ